MKRVIITKPMVGICYMQVCAIKDATDKEILQVANSENRSGTTNGWTEVVRENHKNKSLHPIECEDYPDRKHFIVIC